jgi:hypothetical protein
VEAASPLSPSALLLPPAPSSASSHFSWKGRSSEIGEERIDDLAFFSSGLSAEAHKKLAKAKATADARILVIAWRKNGLHYLMRWK